ncbi:GNAT family acetyltransferase [Leucobacter chromiiresistens]|uniref:Ribosomal protein S18 acetylase RimI n=1 Tax=Leucobacter chromiiresistens TaxID=1079994 RepID=A0A1H1BBB1_9MICO|nr:GNAT family acetyltransferase [Leucobacter chromiiresistens]SDQ49202.1 Ribosomal protein S18 acetylase RimI [Leucobacter chromiiresistens]
MQIRPVRPADADAVVALWEVAGLTRPWNDPRKDIARKREVQSELFVVAESADGRVLGSVMAGYDGHRGWMNYLATHPEARGTGVARALVEHVEQALLNLGCPKLNLQVRADNADVVEFYRHLGYGIDETVSLGKRLIAD